MSEQVSGEGCKGPSQEPEPQQGRRVRLAQSEGGVGGDEVRT